MNDARLRLVLLVLGLYEDLCLVVLLAGEEFLLDDVLGDVFALNAAGQCRSSPQ